MISEQIFQEMNKVIKTGQVIQALANIEINTDRVFTDKELTQTIKRDEINQISRRDLDFKKALIQNKDYNKYLDLIKIYYNLIQDNQSTEEIKKELLELINAKDSIYNTVRKEIFDCRLLTKLELKEISQNKKLQEIKTLNDLKIIFKLTDNQIEDMWRLRYDTSSYSEPNEGAVNFDLSLDYNTNLGESKKAAYKDMTNISINVPLAEADRKKDILNIKINSVHLYEFE